MHPAGLSGIPPGIPDADSDPELEGIRGVTTQALVWSQATVGTGPSAVSHVGGAICAKGDSMILNV